MQMRDSASVASRSKGVFPPAQADRQTGRHAGRHAHKHIRPFHSSWKPTCQYSHLSPPCKSIMSGKLLKSLFLHAPVAFQ